MRFICQFLILLSPVVLAAAGGEFVHIRSNSFGQLVTSNALRWVKSASAKEPVGTPSSGADAESKEICHLQSYPRSVGLVTENVCRVTTSDGEEVDSTTFQLLSGHAARVHWVSWQRPQSPPTGSVVLSPSPNRFIAFHPNLNLVGHVDPALKLGSCVFPGGVVETQCLILVEEEPTGYQLTDIELKGTRGFLEEPIILTADTLPYIPPYPESTEKSRTEKALTYRLENQYDYWGQGHLMATGLHTTVKIPLVDGSDYEVKIIEWGLPSTKSEVVKVVPVWEDLSYGTAVNVTIRGVRRKGDMTFYANLRTTFKDGSYITRHIEGQRRTDLVEGIIVEKGKPYHLSDGSSVQPETTTVIAAQAISVRSEDPADMASSTEAGAATEPIMLMEQASQNLRSVANTSAAGRNNYCNYCGSGAISLIIITYVVARRVLSQTDP